MSDQCLQYKEQYEKLLELKREFDAALETGDVGKDLAEVKRIKAKLEILFLKMERFITVSIAKAKEIFDTPENIEKGKTDVLGPKEVEKAFGIKLETKDIPPIPFSKKDLEKAKELDQFLVLRVKSKDGKPFTMKKINELLENAFKDSGKGKALTGTWHLKESFYTDKTPNLGWALTSKEIVPDTGYQGYLDQSLTIARYLKKAVFSGRELPDEYREAIEELIEKEEELKNVSGWSKINSILNKLKISKLTRQSSVEALYDTAIYFFNNDEQLLKDEYVWTNTAASDNRVVVSLFRSGASINLGSEAYARGSRIGAVFSRRM